jgi:hypothetical protein
MSKLKWGTKEYWRDWYWNRGGRTVNACINSKDLCGKLKTLLNLAGDYFVLKVEELYMDYEKANYKISK